MASKSSTSGAALNKLAKGERRIHKKPRQSHVRACQPWLEAEIDAVKPRVLVCLGSIAAQAVVGPEVRVTSAADAWVRAKS